MSAGILCAKQINELIQPTGGERSKIYRPSDPFDPLSLDSASVDLQLGDHYWEMKGSCRTGSDYNVRDLVAKHKCNGRHDLGEKPVHLKKQNVYLFKADCDLDLSGTRIEGKATGRSSIGRLDVLVRLLVDKSDRFDYVKDGREHELYVEVTPISFDLEVVKGAKLSQLRLYKGKEDDISLTNSELIHEEDDAFPVLNENGKVFRDPCEADPNGIWFPFRLDLTPDSQTKCSAYVAKRPNELKDLSPINPDKKDFYKPEEYWDRICTDEHQNIELEPDRLYILRSKERLRIPGHLALECKSYTTQMGEWRIEYAGFAHPYFGRSRDIGAPIMFEVRGHNVPTILADGIPLGNVRFLRMSQIPDEPQETPSYDTQELTLSKCFKKWMD